MTTHKRKKVVKYRGSKTHGCGSMKKRRGAGNRGGRGLAGTGKRAAHKKQLILKKYGNDYFGKHGFHIQYKPVKIKGINLKDIEVKLDMFMEKGFAKKEGEIISIDLGKIGYNKLLGNGKLKNKFKIKTKFFSKNAKEKLEKMGGEIVTG
ncbi:MAG: 50S ribosomal protein L15 [Nanoarchaeota archaeon]|nr:50S ribosomal protein L15 [Nanoarchaeota archaeon]|tara:strand:+ start:941 stop:1390 length:450 start_codon:yes stop_codon:yes gene_type:complete